MVDIKVKRCYNISHICKDIFMYTAIMEEFWMITVIVLVLLAFIVGGALYLFFAVRARAKKLSRELYGTSDITEAMKRAKLEVAETPKSLSAMTRIELPRIVKDFPAFNYDEMKERAENVLAGYLLGIAGKNTGALSGVTSELKEQLEQRIEMLEAGNLTEHYDRLKVHRTEIKRYTKKAGRCIVTFQSALESVHYVTDIDNNVIRGDREFKEQARFETDMVYIQDRDIVENRYDDAKGLVCPNCGAPVTDLGVKVCRYCGRGIVEYNINVWSFDNITER